MGRAAFTGSAVSLERQTAPSVELAVDRPRRRRIAAVLAADGLHVVPEGEPAAAADAVVIALEEARGADLDLVSALRSRTPGGAVVVLISSPTHATVRRLLDAGADGIVDPEQIEALPRAIQACWAGQLVLPRSFRDSFGRRVLTRREKQVLGLVVMGLSNAEIARRLHLSQSTVKCHLTSSFAKLGARSRSEATALIVDPVRGFGLGVLALTTPGDDRGH
ncbi:MAG TPA: response regulator transcription factor [Gaiellaceae bacterium]|nr:response regulator transcription factor [Gaiellaceae bacterium]